MKKQIQYIAPSRIKPYMNNPRKNDETVLKVAESIQAFGFQNPIIVDKDFVIIAGHTRWKAALKLDLKQVPVIVADDLTSEQVRAYRIADNRLAEFSEWDWERLTLEFENMQDFDWEIVGFSQEEIDAMLEQTQIPSEGLTDEDEVPKKTVTRCEPGNLWQLGRHRLLCGDATNTDDVEQLMGNKKADMVFTDPPYNTDYGNIKHPKFKVRGIKNDSMSPEDYRNFCKEFAANFSIITDGCLYVCHAPAQDGRILASVLDEYYHCSTTIIWVKDVFTLGRGKYQNRYEPIWFGWVKSGKLFTVERDLDNVWEITRPKSSILHPTMKPVELIERAILHASHRGGIVCDPFLGSGTTIIAAEKTNRICYGMEIDPHYCDVIIQRWENYTGQKAKLIEQKK